MASPQPQPEITSDPDTTKGRKSAANGGGDGAIDGASHIEAAATELPHQGCRQKSSVSVPLLEDTCQNGIVAENGEHPLPSDRRQRNGDSENRLNGGNHNNFWSLPEHAAYSSDQYCAGNDVHGQHRNSGGDDMESYFNANAHMLHTSDVTDASGEYDVWPNGDLDQGYGVYESWIANDSCDNPNQQDEGLGMLLCEERDSLNGNPDKSAYLSEEYLGIGAGYGRCNSNDSLYNHCEDEMYQMTVANSIEDIGDFIETDIPENAYGCGSTDSNSSRSRTPSEEDLPTLSLDPASRVTGAGDIQGALSLDWNLQCNLPPAQRPPSLMVANRTSVLTAEIPSGQKSRTASDTDYGFYTPTSCTGSGSSLRTRSVQSPQYSECSATFETTSADSSAFTSPDADHGRLGGPAFQGHRDNGRRAFLGSPEGQSLPSNHSSQTNLSTHPPPASRPKSEGHLFAKLGNLDKQNLDTLLRNSTQEKHIDMKLCNSETNVHPQCSRESGEGAMGSRDLHHHSSLPHMFANPVAAPNRTEQCASYNDLNPTQAAEGRSSQQSDQFNVSRQTSTSDFDQDENSFQEVVDVAPGLLGAACHSCDEFDDDDDNEDLTFSEDYPPPPSYSSCKQCNCSNDPSASSSATKKKKVPTATLR